MFIEDIKEKAKKSPKTIVLPEGNEERTLRAAEIITHEGIAKIILLGNEEEISQKAKHLGVELTAVEIINVSTSSKKETYAEVYYELRKHKGLSLEQAKEQIEDPMYYATIMVHLGEADGAVAGADHPTSWTLGPPLRILKRQEGIKTVSSSFVMVVPDCSYGEKGLFLFADCAMLPNPTAEQLADIAISTADTARNLVGIEPRVAMLSFSTKGSGKDPIVDKVIDATQIAQKKRPGLKLDGELQADAALIPAIGKKKSPESTVAGTANVLIFPDLNAGNIAYKLTERLGKARAFGPIVQGFIKPVNDLSRGCSVDDIVSVVAITSVQAQSN